MISLLSNGYLTCRKEYTIIHKLLTYEVGHGNEIDNVKLTILSEDTSMNMAHEMLRIYTVRLNLHTYTRGCSRIGRNLRSRDLKWENKTYKLKRSIVIISCNIRQDQSYLAL